MYIKSMVLEGFKSYGNRIEINGFDKEFNAITGFNGSGKSNVLDAICFVLGITNLSQVRASSLQDLVYKSGQAGIKKASVTITFDNRDAASSPIGFEEYEEITVMRQIVIGGKNKYMLNGSNVSNKRVQDMFCSVQLNVNNPHFLIMQGRITKVLNMKPMEILSMIEEAAGTRMYELKRQASLKLIEKKENKAQEIDHILKEEIGPRIKKLKLEQSHFEEFQRIERELNLYRRIHIAWKYVTALEKSKKAEEDVQKVKDKIKEKQKYIDDSKQNIINIDQQITEITEKRNQEKGGKLEAIERELKVSENKEHKLVAEFNSHKQDIKAKEKTIVELKSSIADDERLLATKEEELNAVGNLFKKLKEDEQRDHAALLAAQEKYQRISSGLLENENGENATLEQQLITAKQNATQAQTEIKQCEMALTHAKEQLSKKEKEMHNTDKEYVNDSKQLENKEKQLKNTENNLKKLDYDEGALEAKQEQKRVLLKEVRDLQEKLDIFESGHPRLRFQYRDPVPNFNRATVWGLACKLIKMRDSRNAHALENAAGGKLYNVIVDTESTGKLLLQKGQLQQRITIIPLNKVTGRTMDPQTIKFAQNLVGKENVQPAISLIDFPEEVRPAMNWIFGQVFICKDMNTAKKVSFHDMIGKKCVTLEGDVFEPTGILSGGAMSKTGSVLLKLNELKTIPEQLDEKKQLIQTLDAEIAKITRVAEQYKLLKEKFDLECHEVHLIKQRLQQTTHHKIKEEVDALTATIHDMTQKMTVARKLKEENAARTKKLESQLTNSASIRDQQLAEAENQLKILQKKSEGSRKEWQNREQESETLNLEINELQQTIQLSKEQLAKLENELVMLNEKAEQLENELTEIKAIVKEAQNNLKTHKDSIHQQSKEIQQLNSKKDEMIKKSGDLELEIRELNHDVDSAKNSSSGYKNTVTDLKRKYEWIEQDKAYFGEPGGMYDFEKKNIEDIQRKISELDTSREKLSHNVNARAMRLLDKEEQQYNETLKKKAIIENDKRKILETIKHLDGKKKESLLKAWQEVNKNFGSIFSTLLPGAEAKLQPPENQTVLDGLEVKVGFSGVWKDSLGELSGGQRSLVALSLILAMLLFKPAPLYILDEVDAALDLSHTENIGTMLHRHFKQSQFIIVSLKDGMFNNANVLFTTRFIDGMSTISRTHRSKSK
ncbi:structural maintenance of chromosomes protein 2 [Orussus abietinus]|uniref:structural maintenance of chromosomes protein 2 n=1 Tax=Orussus abietinus TaxID=222816 RepID=UPI000626CC58|nr:structural maintenance of chromosomes protein 2 [Orussus abietinus]